MTAPVLAPSGTFDLAALVRRWWFTLLAAVLLGAVFGVGVIKSIDPVYEMTVEVLVGPVLPDADVLRGAADLARTYGEVVESREFALEAARRAGVPADAVNVSAVAGRGSATLSITVQSSSAESVPVAATAVVDQLEALVEESSRPLEGLPLGETGLVDLSKLFPSGSSIVVIDDGGNEVTDLSLGVPVGAAAGGLAAVLITATVVLAIEERHRLDPAAARVAELTGRDLGELVLPPVWGDLLRRRHSLGISRTASRAGLSLNDHLVDGPPDETTVLFVTAPGTEHDYLRALVEIARAVGEPPLIVDPDAALASEFGADFLLTGVTHELHAGGDLIARLVVPRPDQSMSVVKHRSAREVCRLLSGETGVVIVFVADTSDGASFRFWATGVDHAVVVVLGGDVRDELYPIVERLDLVTPTLLGGIRVRRRWVSGRSRRVELRVGRVSNYPGELPDEHRSDLTSVP